MVRCSAHHSFDVAKHGYVNLLGHGSPANADTAAMVAARDRFLSGGHYDPISDAVAAEAPSARRVLEVGAGTGHHLARVLEQLPEADGVALDVSVPASRRAARAHPRMASVVADTWAGLPLQDATVDAVLCIFAPRNPPEFARVLRPGGVVVVVMPRPEHLLELRRNHGLLDVGADKSLRLEEASHGHLKAVSSSDISYDVDLTATQVADLIAMGPNAFHTHETFVAPRVAETVRVSVTCTVLRAAMEA